LSTEGVTGMVAENPKFFEQNKSRSTSVYRVLIADSKACLELVLFGDDAKKFHDKNQLEEGDVITLSGVKNRINKTPHVAGYKWEIHIDNWQSLKVEKGIHENN
jgi:hypothetical protein